MMDLSHIHFHLVDDNDIDISVNVKLLQLAKITENIHTYTSAVKFLEHLRAHSEEFQTGEHVILLDIMMPVMDGFECLSELQRMDPQMLQHTIVFMLSSSIDREVIRKTEKYSFVKRVLEKPLDVYFLKLGLEDIYSD